MQYRGKDVKRTAQYSEDEMMTLKAGESATRKVRISRNYEFDKDGLYYVRVKQPMDKHIVYTDVMRTETKIMVSGTKAHEDREKQRLAQRLAEAEKLVLAQDGVGAIAYQGCSSSKQTQLAGWHTDATHKIASAIACTESSCGSLVDTWFGQQTTQASYAAVNQQFRTMQDVKDSTIYVCQGNAGPCAGGSTFAYVYPTDRQQKVYMCDFTFNYPDYSEKVQTVIHELSHFNHIGDTNDNAYGESTCINLAQSNFQAALQTADNTGYFGKYANTCYQHGPSGYIAANAPTVGCTDRYSNCGEIRDRGSCSQYSTDCCRSCSGTPSNDCTGISGGGSSGGGSFSDSRRRAPSPFSDSRRRAPSSGGGSDTASNCAELIASNGCSGCCITSTGGPVSSVCAGSCASGGNSGGSSGDDSCQYANDGACDEPTYCLSGTDSTDCGRSSAPTTRRRRYTGR